MIAVGGSVAFGLTVGWAAGFAAATARGLGYRGAAAAASLALVWLIAPAGLFAALAGFVAGSAGHALFLWGLQKRRIG